MEIKTTAPIDTFDSIKYASEIQRGLLPKERHFLKTSIDYGVLYQPHSILSGDFYWLGIKEDKIYIAVADCTGHGIAASLLAVMGISLLNYIILGKNHTDIGEYLRELDKKWIETFQAETEQHLFNNDWMEIALVAINKKDKIVEFTGARLYCIILKANGNWIESKTNRYPIGGWQIEKNRYYFSEKFHIEKGDELYLFTDGITDQFGGTKNKKFGIKNLRQVIQKTNCDSISQKINYIKEAIEIWKDNYPQTDDITLIGLKF